MNFIPSSPANGVGLYALWKIEKKIWTEGHSAMTEHVNADAIIVPPYPMPPLRFAELLEASRRAEPFTDIEFSEQLYVNHGNSIILYYSASARHKRYRSRYLARCLTTYVREDGVFKVAAHSHFRLPKN